MMATAAFGGCLINGTFLCLHIVLSRLYTIYMNTNVHERTSSRLLVQFTALAFGCIIARDCTLPLVVLPMPSCLPRRVFIVITPGVAPPGGDVGCSSGDSTCPIPLVVLMLSLLILLLLLKSCLTLSLNIMMAQIRDEYVVRIKEITTLLPSAILSRTAIAFTGLLTPWVVTPAGVSIRAI